MKKVDISSDDARAALEQWKRLDGRLGVDQGASKERARLYLRMEK
jgi:hypothetical protein